MPTHETTRIGFLNSNKRLLANTKSAQEARLKWAQQATDNRLSCLSVCETGHADWKDERTLPFKQGEMRVLQGADARVPPSHDLGGSRGSAAEGVVTLCKLGARTTPYRGTIGDCLGASVRASRAQPAAERQHERIRPPDDGLRSFSPPQP